MNHHPVPFQTAVLRPEAGGSDDGLPAAHRKLDPVTRRHTMAPVEDVQEFLQEELCLGEMDSMLGSLWFAGAKRPANPLLSQLAIGREIVVCERMDLHLLWGDSGKIYVKPLPRFLLDPNFWREHLSCQADCGCQNPATRNAGASGAISKQMAKNQRPTCKEKPRRVALGFLYSYACLICYESDFHIANEKRLLPRSIEEKPLSPLLADDATIIWTAWKTMAREILASHNDALIHPRFWRAELRLSRLNTIHRFTRLPPFAPYIRDWRSYGSLFRGNLTWLATTTVFIALVLTAMQVGLATDQLKGSPNFMAASYGFSVFAILGPICVLGLVVLAALFNLAKDLPWLLHGKSNSRKMRPVRDSVPA